jgi:hypothetical protein
MGASAAEIDEQIDKTREHLDANLDVLERRAASGLKRAAVIAGIGLAAAVVAGGIVFLVVRRIRRPSLRDRMYDAIPGAVFDLPDEIKKKLSGRPFKVIITNADVDEGRGGWESAARKVAPTIVTSAVSAVMGQVMQRRSDEKQSTGE